MDSGNGDRFNYQRGGGHDSGRGFGSRGQSGRGRGNRYQPYRNRNKRPVNAQDSETAVIREISSFVSRVGEFKNILETPEGSSLRQVEATSAENIDHLVNVLCSEDKIEMLFKYQVDPVQHPSMDSDGIAVVASPMFIKAEDKVGKLGRVIISCTASLPLQTPCYAALTLAVHEKIKGSRWDGFAHRCVGFAMHHFVKDLDDLLSTGERVAHSACRMKLLLRYIAILGRMGMVKGYESEHAADPNKLTMFGLLSMMVQAAQAAQTHNALVVSYLLSYLVLSTLPYVMEYSSQESISECLLKPLEVILTTYKSPFTPGTGRSAILLKFEQDDGDLIDDDEDWEETEGDSSGQICDSLQDLLRIATKFSEPSRFALPRDSPWKGLTRTSNSNPERGETETVPVTFTEEPIYLSIDGSQSLRLLIGGGCDFKLAPFSLDGVVFGRFPIFGSPPSPEDDDDEEIMSNGAPKNENLEAFKVEFGLLDRFFVSEILRDCMIAHEPFVSPSGLQQGSAKSVAEELLSVHHVLTGDIPSKGMEYAIVEALFGLIAQAPQKGPLQHIYISRVLLELTRIHPQLFSPALAVAMTNLFGDYLPALVPAARDKFSRWFCFHLVNTEYQWPKAFWELWQPYALSSTQSSRGDFVRRALQLMVENVSKPSVLVAECLTGSKKYVGGFFPRSSAVIAEHVNGSQIAALEAQIHTRVWDRDEGPDVLMEFLFGPDVADVLKGVEGTWLRSTALARVLVSPINEIHGLLKDSLDSSDKSDDDMMDDISQSKDRFVVVLDAIPRYSTAMQGVLRKEAETSGEDVTRGGAICLHYIEAISFFNSSMLEGVVASLLRQSVINGVSVAHWALGEVGDSSTTAIIPRWWTYMFDALRFGSHVAEGSDGIILDGNAAAIATSSDRIDTLNYIMNRSCSLLAAGSNEKKLSPTQVDLVEGTKYVVARAVLMTNTEDALAASLADLCAGFGDSVPIELLKNSLLQF